MQNFEKEIKQQPDIIKNILAKHIDKSTFLNLPEISDFTKVTFVASGTSKNAGDFAAYFFEQIAQIPSKSEFASEILEKKPIFNENDLVVFISQSGQSADVLSAHEKIKKTGAKTLAATNRPDSPLSNNANYKIDLEAGEELAIPATKSFSATVVKLFILALYFAQKKAIDVTEFIDDLQKLPDAAEKILSSKFPSQFANNFDAKIFLGRGLCHFALNESALKLKEASLTEVSCIPLGEYVHGHMVTLNSSIPIYAVSFGFDELNSCNLNLIERIKSNYNPKITIITEDIFSLQSKYLTPLLIVILFQAIACEISKIKGLNPDKPTGLKKVTE